MKFFIQAPKENIYTFLRRLGYRFERQAGDELVFSRIIGGASGYPRFHAYIKLEENGNGSAGSPRGAVFNLHLDQKKPIYKGARAHGGEYEGKVIEGEAERIRKTIMTNE